jgi:hypothetical protein
MPLQAHTALTVIVVPEMLLEWVEFGEGCPTGRALFLTKHACIDTK